MYVLVLGASLLVATIGISSLMAARVQLRATSSSRDQGEARELARTAVDRGLWEMNNNNAGWRGIFEAGTLTDISFGNGAFSLQAVDPVDNKLLDDPSDPVFLIGIGKSGNARYMLAVMCNSDGTVQTGTWRQAVDAD